MSIRTSRFVRKHFEPQSITDGGHAQVRHRNATTPGTTSGTATSGHRVSPMAAVLLCGSFLAITPLLGDGAAHAIDVGGVKESAGAYVGVNPTSQARLQRKQDELIAACMKKQAFQTFPNGADIPQDALDGGLTNRKSFVEKYGYGISTLTQPPKPGTTGIVPRNIWPCGIRHRQCWRRSSSRKTVRNSTASKRCSLRSSSKIH
jgi:hypothetical protein